MIADVVNLAMMGIAFCQAAGRLILHRGAAAGINTVVTHYRARDISALTKDL
jgi:hypothetical protein